MRVPKVTRTVLSTSVHLMMVNTETKEVFEQDVILPRTYKDNKKIMKLVEAIFENDPVKPVGILGTAVEESLYGMSEADFLKYAEKMPPRKAKPEGNADNKTEN